jgi:hypothetical protein
MLVGSLAAHWVVVGEHAAQSVPTQAPFGHGVAVVQTPSTQVRRLVPFITHSAAPIAQSAQKSAVPSLMQPLVQVSTSLKRPLLDT